MAGASITSPNTTLQTNGNGIVSYTGPKAGIKKVLSNLIPNVPVRVKINLVYSSKPMYIAVAEGSAQSPSVYSNLLYSTMSNGSINFTFTPTQPSVELSMRLFYISTPFAPLPYMSFTLDSVSYTQQTDTSSSTQLVQISNKLKGGYRFGYNGQEKVDEIAGAGNHTTAEFWEYDTRLGRRWNRDPVDQISISNYACFKINPIWYSDPNGDVPDDYFYDKKGNQTDLVKNDQPDKFFVQDNNGTTSHNGQKYNQIGLNSELGYLSRIIFAEAGGQNLASKEAVGDVMKNRVESPKFPDTYKEVAEQKITTKKGIDIYQFSSVSPKDPSNWRYSTPTLSLIHI